MIPLSFNDIQLLIAAAVFVLGFLLILIGALVMVSRSYSREVRTLAAHTARLGQVEPTTYLFIPDLIGGKGGAH